MMPVSLYASTSSKEFVQTIEETEQKKLTIFLSSNCCLKFKNTNISPHIAEG